MNYEEYIIFVTMYENPLTCMIIRHLKIAKKSEPNNEFEKNFFFIQNVREYIWIENKILDAIIILVSRHRPHSLFSTQKSRLYNNEQRELVWVIFSIKIQSWL